MNKIEYEKPMITIIEMEQESPVLAGSSTFDSSRGDGYGDAIPGTW